MTLTDAAVGWSMVTANHFVRNTTVEDEGGIVERLLRTMPHPIQDPEAYLDWLETNFSPEMRKDAEPFWRRMDSET